MFPPEKTIASLVSRSSSPENSSRSLVRPDRTSQSATEGSSFPLPRASSTANLSCTHSRVTTAPSSKTSYVVLGSEAGPKKLEMIKKHNIKTLTEDQFLELIGSRPSGAADPKYKEQQKKEEEKIKVEAKKIGPKKDDA